MLWPVVRSATSKISTYLTYGPMSLFLAKYDTVRKVLRKNFYKFWFLQSYNLLLAVLLFKSTTDFLHKTDYVKFIS